MILFQIVLSELSIRSLIGTVYFRYPNLTALFCNLSILTKYVEELAQSHTGRAYLKSDIKKIMKVLLAVAKLFANS